ncbi:MAG: phosphonate ABC transporter, permease protein PhnE [Chloroflexota bacterium]
MAVLGTPGVRPRPRFEDVRGPGFSPVNVLLALVLGGVIVLSFQQSHVSIFEPFDARNVRSVSRFVAGLFPPELAFDFLSSIGRLLLETVWISIAGTTLAFVLAIPLAAGAMRSRGEEASRASLGTVGWLAGWAVYGGSRTFLNIARAIPELVWALIFVVAVGLGPFAGVLALAAHSAGILGKLYAELLESVDQRVVEAARATGASEGAVTLLARIPMALPVLLSYTLFRWECNMRAATVLGFVGAGGIGTQLSISMKLFQYNEVLTLALAILLLVTLVDVVGGIARARVLDAPTIAACEPGQRNGLVQRAVAFFGRADG